ncbi:hypothetical protein [Burkholderia sp. Ac-20353]|uniref:hypothetical protein n=1 Tax=Burkholderia sp. Ac-20353 TaxID=2703894 RepID=UPI001F122440|nr:hypothetical protein [Burkholderia sp. Ac-20353]
MLPLAGAGGFLDRCKHTVPSYRIFKARRSVASISEILRDQNVCLCNIIGRSLRGSLRCTAAIREADPAVTAFCERPGFIQSEGKRYLADFWVRYFDRHELVILFDLASEPSAKPDALLEHAGLTVRAVQSSEIAASRTWIANWKRMLSSLITTRGLIPPSLSSAIERFVARPHRLLSIEREFTTGDPVLVRAAVFGLLHAGRVRAPELRTHELSLLTVFVAVGDVA